MTLANFFNLEILWEPACLQNFKNLLIKICPVILWHWSLFLLRYWYFGNNPLNCTSTTDKLKLVSLFTVCRHKPLATLAVPPFWLWTNEVKEASNLESKWHPPELSCSQGTPQEPEKETKWSALLAGGEWTVPEETLMKLKVICLSKVLGLLPGWDSIIYKCMSLIRQELQKILSRDKG